MTPPPAVLHGCSPVCHVPRGICICRSPFAVFFAVCLKARKKNRWFLSLESFRWVEGLAETFGVVHPLSCTGVGSPSQSSSKNLQWVESRENPQPTQTARAPYFSPLHPPIACPFHPQTASALLSKGLPPQECYLHLAPYHRAPLSVPSLGNPGCPTLFEHGAIHTVLTAISAILRHGSCLSIRSG